MKYFLDTEFLEGPQNKKFLGLTIGKTKPTIDLISIGLVSEDGREYYAISKEFNLKEAWNRYDLKLNKHYPMGGEYYKEYWIRENVLRPIFNDLWIKKSHIAHLHGVINKFTYNNFKRLVRLYGKSNKQISIEARNFIMETGIDYGIGAHTYTPVDIYTYYGDYDWVVFCWLFGKMIDLPKGFPMYSKDLKQIFDQKNFEVIPNGDINGVKCSPVAIARNLKAKSNYPKQENEHNALADARWNKRLYDFLYSL